MSVTNSYTYQTHMEKYVATRQSFEKMLNQKGGEMLLYTINQSGNGHGLGNFFGKVVRYSKPLEGPSISMVHPDQGSIGNKIILSSWT